MESAKVRGLDFGTSTSLVSESSILGPQVVPIGRLERWLPSLVAHDQGRWISGEAASSLPESQIIRSIKRAITRSEEHISIVQDGRHVLVNADAAIIELLRHIASAADASVASLGEEGIVRLGCPAIWDGPQRKRFIRLATAAGIAVGDNTLIEEPIAAGIAWINQRVRLGQKVSGKVLVFDMGGGTLDVAVLEVDARNDSGPAISVQAAVGEDEAGDALDECIALDLEAKLAQSGFDVGSHADADEIRSWIRLDARAAKLELSSELDVPVVFSYPHAALPSQRYSREELETAFTPQLTRALETVTLALRAALMAQVAGSRTDAVSLTPSEARQKTLEQLAVGVDYVLVMGGMGLVPATTERLGAVFRPDRVFVGVDDDPTTAIVTGLAEHDSYERLNLHRPGFDFVVEWFDEATSVFTSVDVYGAYSPLYSRQSVLQTNSTKFRWAPKSAVFPSKGSGLLKVKSVSGNVITFKLEGKEGNGITFGFGSSLPFVSLEPNGRVFIRDGAGRERSARIAQWPVIRGTRHEAIVMTRDESAERKPVPELVWHQRPYD